MTELPPTADKEALLCEITNLPAYFRVVLEDVIAFNKQYIHVLPSNEREQFSELETQIRLALSRVDEASEVAGEILDAYQ